MPENPQGSPKRDETGTSSTIVLPIISEYAAVAVPGVDAVLNVMKSIQTACNRAEAHKVRCITPFLRDIR